MFWLTKSSSRSANTLSTLHTYKGGKNWYSVCITNLVDWWNKHSIVVFLFVDKHPVLMSFTTMLYTFESRSHCFLLVGSDKDRFLLRWSLSATARRQHENAYSSWDFIFRLVLDIIVCDVKKSQTLISPRRRPVRTWCRHTLRQHTIPRSMIAKN
jgi:hypothetical protein